jgi:hypothetical protein
LRPLAIRKRQQPIKYSHDYGKQALLFRAINYFRVGRLFNRTVLATRGPFEWGIATGSSHSRHAAIEGIGASSVHDWRRSKRLSGRKAHSFREELFGCETAFVYAGHGHVESTGGYIIGSDASSVDEGLLQVLFATSFAAIRARASKKRRSPTTKWKRS